MPEALVHWPTTALKVPQEEVLGEGQEAPHCMQGQVLQEVQEAHKAEAPPHGPMGSDLAWSTRNKEVHKGPRPRGPEWLRNLCLSACMYVCVSVCLFVFVCLFVSLPACFMIA